MGTAQGGTRTRVLLIGSGGREHALSAAMLQSPTLAELQVAPGNPGTEPRNVVLDVSDHGAVVTHCVDNAIDLVVVGPEVPLVAGLADDLAAAGIACFGPSAAAAQLEGSKAFARAFAERHGIPGPAYGRFTEVEPALAFLDELAVAVVVKADGLAAGKGVVLPDTRADTERAIFEMLASGSMGAAGASVVIEERMEGEELSLFGISSAGQLDALGGLTAQDHKRVGAGDTGPNTGGMGAFAPVPGLDPGFIAELADVFLVRASQGLAAEGTPYVGVIYAGVMLTANGPRLVEYNCRFGDPEAQVLLPLLDGDIVEVMLAAARGRSWTPLAARPDTTAATVVVAAEGYPDDPVKGIFIPDAAMAHNGADGATVLHAGTARTDDGAIVSSGGRVLNVVGIGPDLDAALASAYRVVDRLTDATGLFARPDIGWRHASHVSANSSPANSSPADPKAESVTSTDLSDGSRAVDAYADAGVSFAAGDAAIEQIAEAVKSTHNERVVAGVGSFGGVFDMAHLGIAEPLLVSSTDTCGTKTVLAAELDSWDGIGADIVNHGVNDVLVQGARPLFMLDTISAGVLDPDIVGRVVRSMAGACRQNGCVLLGGETAEVPDLIVPGGVDVAGTMVGVVDRSELLPSSDVSPGDVLIGLRSSGLHTNGYSLARKLGADFGFDRCVPGTDTPLGEALLVPHRSYLGPLGVVLTEGLVKALAHLTGGGFVDNIPRCLPVGMGAAVDTSTWDTPPLFAWLAEAGGLDLVESHRIFNMGIGMVAVVSPGAVEAFQKLVAEPTFVIGTVTDREGVELS